MTDKEEESHEDEEAQGVQAKIKESHGCSERSSPKAW